MTKRILTVTAATIEAWNQQTHPGAYVVNATMAENDPSRGFYTNMPIQTSRLVTIDGVEIKDVAVGNDQLAVGTVIETLNTIYKVV